MAIAAALVAGGFALGASVTDPSHEQEQAAAAETAKAKAATDEVSGAELNLVSPDGKPAAKVKDCKFTETAADDRVSSLAEGSRKIVSDSAAAPADGGVWLTPDGKIKIRMGKEIDGDKVIYDGNTITVVRDIRQLDVAPGTYSREQIAASEAMRRTIGSFQKTLNDGTRLFIYEETCEIVHTGPKGSGVNGVATVLFYGKVDHCREFFDAQQ